MHTGFQHVTANLLMWLALALPLEYAYGSARILAVWLISALGSALFAAAFQAQCTLVSSALPVAQVGSSQFQILFLQLLIKPSEPC